MIFLKVFNDRRNGEIICVDKFPFSVGRNPECSLVLQDEGVSEIHFVIEEDEAGTISVVDHDTKNGTWVGDERIEAAIIEKDLNLLLGNTQIEISLDYAREVTKDLPQPTPLLERKFQFGSNLYRIIFLVYVFLQYYPNMVPDKEGYFYALVASFKLIGIVFAKVLIASAILRFFKKAWYYRQIEMLWVLSYVAPALFESAYLHSDPLRPVFGWMVLLLAFIAIATAFYYLTKSELWFFVRRNVRKSAALVLVFIVITLYPIVEDIIEEVETTSNTLEAAYPVFGVSHRVMKDISWEFDGLLTKVKKDRAQRQKGLLAEEAKKAAENMISNE